MDIYSLNSPRRMKMAVILSGFAIFLMAVYIYIRFERSSEVTPIRMTEKDNAAATKKERAFLEARTEKGNIKKGARQKIEIKTNTWAKCEVRLFDPKGERVGENGAVKSEGEELVWDWTVPPDADSGSWVARVACGETGNMATQDLGFKILPNGS